MPKQRVFSAPWPARHAATTAPLGKSDRAVLLGLLALVLVFVPRSGLYALVFPVLDTLLCLTICNRIRHGMKEAAAKRNP